MADKKYPHPNASRCFFSIIPHRIAIVTQFQNPDAPTIVLLLAKGDEELMHVGDEFVAIESDLSLANRLIDVTQFD